MRPVDKGTAPRVYREPSEAQPDLVERLGRFCSYCERFIASSIHVEHKRPESRYPAEREHWDNFLLACANCNSAKLDKKIVLSRYLWPDVDNTYRAFVYSVGGIVRVNRRLPKRIRRKAGRTLFLLGLDKHPGSHREPSDRDYRYSDRRTQWEKARIMRRQLRAHDTPGQREAVEASAKDGMFSVWMQAFEDDPDIRTRLIRMFRPAPNCFHAVTTAAVPRPGGRL